jgi:hypothetical protein
MAKRDHLNIPVIGVAKAGWNLDQLRVRAKRGDPPFDCGATLRRLAHESGRLARLTTPPLNGTMVHENAPRRP